MSPESVIVYKTFAEHEKILANVNSEDLAYIKDFVILLALDTFWKGKLSYDVKNIGADGWFFCSCAFSNNWMRKNASGFSKDQKFQESG